MMNKKADNLTINKLIIIILAILVLLALLMFIFKVDILEWLRNLPDYTYEGDKEIDYTKLSPDKLALLNCVKIAEIGKKDIDVPGQDVREMFMYLDESRIVPMKLKVDVDDPNHYFVKVIEWKGMATIDVGEVKDKILKINEEVIKNYATYEKTFVGIKTLKLKDYVLEKDLNKLNGAHLLGVLLLCKTKEEMKKPSARKVILGVEREIILDDGTGRCTVELEEGVYGLKNGKLELYENEKWENIDDQLPSEAQIKEAEIAHDLIKKEKEIKDYLDNYDIRFCGNRNPRDAYCIAYPLVGIGEIDIYTEAIDSYYIYEKGTKNNIAYLGNAIDNYIKQMNSKTLDFEVFRRCPGQGRDVICYLAKGTYYVREGKIFVLDRSSQEIKKFDENLNKYVYMPKEEFEDLTLKKRIKEDLIEACKK